MTGLVVTNPPRPERDVVDAFAAYGVATVHEAQGRTGLLGSHLAPIQRGTRIAGTAVTVTVAPGDNTTIAVAVEQCQDGDVLVVAPTAPCDMGYFGTTKGTLGDVNVPISIAGRIVEPGDVVVADDDGVVVVPRRRAADVLAASKAREEKEARSRARYAAGEIALDVNGMRPLLEKAGIRYVDYEDYRKERDR